MQQNDFINARVVFELENKLSRVEQNSKQPTVNVKNGAKTISRGSFSHPQASEITSQSKICGVISSPCKKMVCLSHISTKVVSICSTRCYI